MDPISQAALGAALPGALARRERVRAALLLGALSGMAPDLDVLIQSPTDPLLFLEYHRHFTHSLAFIPIGATLCALALHGLVRRTLRPVETWLWCLAGYATHALLDACTAYGTQLWWPFTQARVAWNWVSVVDPLATLPILALVIAAALRRSPRLAGAGLAWLVGYLLVGGIQHQRAVDAGAALAAERGLAPTRIEAFPQYASLLVWRVVSEADGHFHVDAVRTGLGTRAWPGTRVAVFERARDLPWLPADSQQARDVARFAWFTSGWLAIDPADPLRLIDVRYSVLPMTLPSIFAIRLRPGAAADAHVAWDARRDASTALLRDLWALQRGDDPPGGPPGRCIAGAVAAGAGRC